MSKPAKPRLRILLGAEIALGPGKADLLEAIARSGSISAAGRELGMSYRRAWNLVEVMNRSFRSPLVETLTGGAGGGGARVTEFGVDVLARYRVMETKAAMAVAPEMKALARLMASTDES
jgi:molybdate transport system regulatory protein